MADEKITALVELAASALVAADQLPIVDVSDTTQAGTGSTKRMAASAFARGLTPTSVKTAAYTAASGELVLGNANGASGDFAVTLKASPLVGDLIGVLLQTAHATRTVTIGRNGSNVNGGTDTEKWRLVTAGDLVIFQYVDSTTGWVVIDDGIQSIRAKLYDATTASVNTGALQKQAIDTALFDTASGFDSGNNRYTLRRGGRYRVWCHGVFNSLASNAMIYSQLRLNGNASLQRANAQTEVGTGAANDFLLNGIVGAGNYSAGDYLEMYAAAIGTASTPYAYNSNYPDAAWGFTVEELR